MKNPFKTLIHNKNLPGIIFAAGLALPATYLGNKFPVIGGPIFGIVIGLVLALGTKPETFDKGFVLTAKYAVPASVVFLGFGINLTLILNLAKESLILAAFTFAVTLIVGYIAAKALKIDDKTAALIGIGSAVGGITSAGPIGRTLNADLETKKSAVSAITFISLLAAFLLPVVGHAAKFGDSAFGTFSGAAAGDLTAAAAAGFAINVKAGLSAIAVNLIRLIFIVPITLIMALITRAKEKGTSSNPSSLRFNFIKVFPWFILGFIAAAAIESFAAVPPKVSEYLTDIGEYILVMGAASIGIQIEITKLLKSGRRKLLFAFVCFAAIAATAFFVKRYLL